MPRPHPSLAGRCGAGFGHAVAHHGARPQGQFRQPRQRAKNARLQRNRRRDRRSHCGQRCRREHHSQQPDLGGRRRQRQAVAVATHDAALRHRVPADAQRRCRAAFPRRGQEFQRAVRFGRRRAGDEGKAQQADPGLQLGVRAMGREHRRYHPARRAHQPRHRERDTGGRQDHRRRAESCRHRWRRAGGVAHPNPARHPRSGIGGDPDRARLQLADRALDHPTARETGRGHEAACRRRYLGAPGCHPCPRRDRRYGGYRRGVSRQYDRARAALRRRE